MSAEDYLLGEEPPNYVVCKYCGTDWLHWEQDGERWILCDEDGEKHKCAAKRKGAK